ncbi:MAG TPA: glycosyltransferase family 87 protein [Myxococcaceae bacterium]|nr:glycosyltransferase family 87 protein [Myxococcaceae bacterium]
MRAPPADRPGAGQPLPARPAPGVVRPWIGWCLVTFGLWNSCASHAGARWSEGLLASGKYPRTPAFAIAALRGAGTDDGDPSRYLAYASAVLGRPYQGFYVRPVEGWTGPQPERPADPDDPQETPPVRPGRPLVPYRDFSVEYPPGFFLLALPPALPGLGLDGYRTLFSLLMGLLLTGALLAAVRMGRVLRPLGPPSPVALATVLVLALGTITVRRFDAIVALALCVFVDGCLTRRPVRAGVALGVGLLTKLVPVLLVPLGVVHWAAGRRWRELGTAAGVSGLVVLAVGVPFLLLAGDHLFDPLRYHAWRPLEVESTGAALLTLGRWIDPASAHRVEGFGFDNVVGPADRFLLPLATVGPLLAAGGILLWSVVQTRRARASPDGERLSGEILLRGCCATLAASMALGKVFSAQYLTWLLPAGALVCLLDTGRRRRVGVALLAGAMLLTQLDQHVFYGIWGKGPEPIMGLLFLLRNALVMVWAAWILRSPVRRSGASAAPQSRTHRSCVRER